VFELWICKQIPSLKFTRIWLSGNYKVCISDKDNQKILTQTFYHYFIFQMFQYQQPSAIIDKVLSSTTIIYHGLSEIAMT